MAKLLIVTVYVKDGSEEDRLQALKTLQHWVNVTDPSTWKLAELDTNDPVLEKGTNLYGLMHVDAE